MILQPQLETESSSPLYMLCWMQIAVKSSPPVFKQVWTLRARIDSCNLPILYALLDDKLYSSYASILESLHGRCPDLYPMTTKCDFEKAEHIATALVFPNATIRGCMFHFNQAQMRPFQKIPSSNSDEVLRPLLSSVYGLPFLPIDDVLPAWTQLKTNIWILYPSSSISDYINYFETIPGCSHQLSSM